ncbi:MAG: PorP/SprF family type IX secretion system membrane protein [Cyclobacteriaceae bacterium]|nr:PorP/SprF family type IX secretion system membrane protein [Cyclobacteriaceae bacterium]
MKRRLLIFSCFLLSFWASGQSPLPYRQFYFNPYLFNPAFNAVNGYSELSLMYRRQWLNINDAPTSGGFSFQYPTQRRVSLGFNFSTQEIVALRNSVAMATFAYAIPITSTQSLRFGLSAGLGINDLNLKEGEYDPNDPVIINASQNNFYMDGNFGVAYTNQGFRLGFALTRIFDSNIVNEESFNEVNLSRLKNRLYSVSYRFSIVQDLFDLEPYFLYRETPDSQNSWEAASLLYIKDKLWLGASYHETKGYGFFLGATIKDMFRFGYSYELPPIDGSFGNTNSHEMQISLLFGEKRQPQAKARKEKLKPVVATNPQPEEIVQVEPTPVEAQPEKFIEPVEQERFVTETIQKQPEISQPQSVAEESEAEPKPAAKPPLSFTLGKGHYVVIGAFKIMENAMHYALDLQQKGLAIPTVALNPKNQLYYVYIYSSYDLDEARKVRNQNRVKRPFKEAWLFTME